MASQAFTETTPPGIVNRHSHTISWGPCASGDTCVANGNLGGETARSIQIEGTANGATVAIKGSNDGTNFEILNDSGGSQLTGLSTGTLKGIREISLWIQPVLTGGGAQTSITITFFGARPF